jgi:hypothetical protein
MDVAIRALRRREKSDFLIQPIGDPAVNEMLCQQVGHRILRWHGSVIDDHRFGGAAR